MYEGEDGTIFIQLQVPGVDRESIDITVEEDNQLKIVVDQPSGIEDIVFASYLDSLSSASSSFSSSATLSASFPSSAIFSSRVVSCPVNRLPTSSGRLTFGCRLPSHSVKDPSLMEFWPDTDSFIGQLFITIPPLSS